MRTIGTVVRGVRAPIIKAGDDLANIVVESLMEAQKEEGFKFRDKDIVAVTEAVVGKAEGNFVTVDDIANDINSVLFLFKSKFFIASFIMESLFILFWLFILNTFL